MTDHEPPEDFWARIQREEADRQARMRALFFASGDAIPDLDMWPPCSVCNGSLEYDEAWYCPGCHITWQRGGVDGTKEDE